MLLKTQRMLSTLNTVLANQPPPQSQDETLRLTATALRQVLGDIRCLFYLAGLSPAGEPFNPIPCPARWLDPGIFVCQDCNPPQLFTFMTNHTEYFPLEATHQFGLLFLERLNRPLSRGEQSPVALVATQ